MFAAHQYKTTGTQARLIPTCNVTVSTVNDRTFGWKKKPLNTSRSAHQVAADPLQQHPTQAPASFSLQLLICTFRHELTQRHLQNTPAVVSPRPFQTSWGIPNFQFACQKAASVLWPLFISFVHVHPLDGHELPTNCVVSGGRHRTHGRSPPLLVALPGPSLVQHGPRDAVVVHFGLCRRPSPTHRAFYFPSPRFASVSTCLIRPSRILITSRSSYLCTDARAKNTCPAASGTCRSSRKAAHVAHTLFFEPCTLKGVAGRWPCNA